MVKIVGMAVPLSSPVLIHVMRSISDTFVLIRMTRLFVWEKQFLNLSMTGCMGWADDSFEIEIFT